MKVGNKHQATHYNYPYKSNNNTGNFIMLVNPEKTYSIIVESDDYHSYTADLDFNINDSKALEFKLERKGKHDD